MQYKLSDLSLDEVNLILEGIGNMPFVRVAQLVVKLQQQTQQQFEAAQKPALSGSAQAAGDAEHLR